MAGGGVGRRVDACGTAHHPQTLALQGHDAPHAPAAHIAYPSALAHTAYPSGLAHTAYPSGVGDAQDWQRHLNDCPGPWSAHVILNVHLANSPWGTGRPKAPLETWPHTGHRTHPGHAELIGSHHICCTLRSVRMLICSVELRFL